MTHCMLITISVVSSLELAAGETLDVGEQRFP
jgi:hypothetical protein